MGLLNEQDRKVVDRWFELFRYGKRWSDRLFIEEAVALMSEQVHSELGRRKAWDNEKPIKVKISGGIDLYEEIRRRLSGEQHRKLTEILGSIKRELPEFEYSYLKQPIEALKNRKPRDRERILAKKGIDYSLTSELCKLKH